MRRALAALLCAAALLLFGCGGGGDESASAPSGSTEASTAATIPAEPSPQGSGQGGAKKKAGKAPTQARVPAPHHHLRATVRVPPISSAPVAGSTEPAPGVKIAKGGDNSVQTYGVEQGSAERTEAAIALQSYLNARLEEDWARVCSYLAKAATEQLERFIEGPKGKQEGLSSCPQAMAALGGEGAPPSQAREQARITEVLSFRGGGEVPGDPSYLIFTAPPEATLYSMPMYLEGGQWKVGLAIASELPV